MITLPAISTAANSGHPMTPPVFPADLGDWVAGAELVGIVMASAARSGGASWLNLVSEETPERPANDLLVLLTYCYLQSIYHSIDVLRRLETDEGLREMRERLRLESLHISKWHMDWTGTMRCNGHTVKVAAWRNVPTGIAETIIWRDGVEVMRQPAWMSNLAASPVAAQRCNMASCWR